MQIKWCLEEFYSTTFILEIKRQCNLRFYCKKDSQNKLNPNEIDKRSQRKKINTEEKDQLMVYSLKILIKMVNSYLN